jgi:peptide/nickel transport system permease protein
MRRFIVRRFFASLLAVVGATMLVFGLSRFLGDPRYIFLGEVGYGMTQERWDALARELHLDRPVPVQFVYWAWDVLRADLGNDLQDNRPIAPKLAEKFSATVKLGVVAWVLATVVGIPLGVVSAVKRGTPLDYGVRAFALFGQALPTFWIGILAILIFAVWLRWLPAGTMGEGLAIRNYILPTITLAWLPAAAYLRFTRSSMLEVLDSEYIKLARAKGVGSWAIIWKHAFKNAALVPLTATALVLASFLTGSVLVEYVFGWPGIGFFLVQAVWANNINVLVAIILFFTVLFIITNFIVDILYAYVDPRIRYS